MANRILRFNHDVTGSIEEATSREWLETNGLGGFAASTIIGLNTRRYHGLLVAATKPPVGRVVLLSKLEETLIIRGVRYDLSANRYPDVIHPQGHQYLREFRLDPFPVFIYRIEDTRLEKRVFMVHGENATVVEYELLSREECTLEVRPLIAFRDYHSATHRNGVLNSHVAVTPGMTRITPYEGLPSLHISHNRAEVELTGHWYENFEYEAEQNRGLDYREDLFNPFVLTFVISHGKQANLIASIDPREVAEAPELRAREIRRREHVLSKAPLKQPIVQTLIGAADQFIVSRGELKTIIAGYHWFADWGRDTMIALPGLTLVSGRAEIARSILLAFADSLDQGMLPNRFPDGSGANLNASGIHSALPVPTRG
jgi:predicted glycogen debranching enzyme